MKVNIFMWIMSILPILTLLFLISYLKLDSSIVSFLSLLITIIISIFVYKLNIDQIIIASSKGLVLSLYVSLIIISAIFLYNIVEISGGFETVNAFIKKIKGNRALQFIGLSWAFSGFIQGVTGFGVPAAIVAGILIGMGFDSIKSITAGLVGHSWAISFGSMGSAFFALQLVTGLDAIKLGVVMSILFFIPILTTGIFTAYIYDGITAIKNNLQYILFMTLLIGAGQLLSAVTKNAHLGSLVGGLLGTLFFMVIIFKNNHLSVSEYLKFQKNDMNIILAILPYLILIISVLFLQIPIIKNIIPQIKLDFSFPSFTTDLGYYVAEEKSFSPIILFEHPFFFLFLSSISAIIIYSKKGLLNVKDLNKIFRKSYQKSKTPIITVFFLMIMALIMNNSGMILNFAQGISMVTSNIFPIISPLIGILGAFLTGSNTSSHV
ncbi:MAG: L-lactate permease, partial [Candidatus Woesearchaeota archaeon]